MPRSKFGGKKSFLQNFIFYHPYESINFQPAGFLAFKEKSGPLLHPYLNDASIKMTKYLVGFLVTTL